MLPDGVDSAAQVDALLRVLRMYADCGTGRKLITALSDMADGAQEGLVAFEPGSEEWQVEAVLSVIHRKLAVIVLDLYLEMGTARIEAAEWLNNVTPEDFGGSPW